MVRKLLTISLLLAGAFSARGESIEECRRLAEENYPLVQRYDILRQTEQFTLSNIAKGWLPQITAYAQGTGQNAVAEWPDALETMLHAQGYDVKGISRMQYRAGIDLQQTIYDGGAIGAARQVAQAQSAVETAKTDVDLYALRRRVEDVCFSWLLVEERLKQNDELQLLLASNVAKLQALHEEGVALKSDVDAMRAELASVRQQATELQSTRSSLRQVLTLLCGHEVQQVEMPSDALIGTSATEDPSSNIIKAYAGNAGAYANNAGPYAKDTFSDLDARPEFRLYDAQLSFCNAQERSLRASRMPKLGLFAQGYYGYTGFNMFHDMMEREPSFNALVGARLTWNISSLYTRRGDKRRLEAQRRGVENLREVFVFNQQLQATGEQETILRYKRLLADDDEIVTLRRSVRQAAEAKLEGGIIDTNGLLQEINREHQAVLNRSVHQIEHMKAIYELNNTLGK